MKTERLTHQEESLKNVLLERLERKLGTSTELDRITSSNFKTMVETATKLGLHPACCFECSFIVKGTLECNIPFYSPRHNLGVKSLEEVKHCGIMCKMFRRPLKYKVYENNKCVLETDDEEEATRRWKEKHQETPGLYHEVWKFDADSGKYNGIRQAKPGDSQTDRNSH